MVGHRDPRHLYKSSNNNTETTDSEAFFKNGVIKPLSDESADLVEYLKKNAERF